MKKISVLIVDDSALIRKIFQQILADEPDIEVLGAAEDPYDAREKIKQLNPDVLTLDVEMPKMDGISFLEKIMTLRPMPVVMVSTLTTKGADTTLRALELGAIDYIAKPTGNDASNLMRRLQYLLPAKIRVAAHANMANKNLPGSDNKTINYTPNGNKIDMIAIGSSTGGVEALRDIFLKLPANCPPIVITQHMPESFTRSFAARLNSLSKLEVVEASDGDKLKTGCAYIAPGGRHLEIERRDKHYYCKLLDTGSVSGHRPSVDVLFSSVAKAAGESAVGVILTGMGKDGAAGMLKMKQAGAYNIGQNQSSCIVYGMPKAAIAIGAVDLELPLSDIPAEILRYCETEEKKGAKK